MIEIIYTGDTYIEVQISLNIKHAVKCVNKSKEHSNIE